MSALPRRVLPVALLSAEAVSSWIGRNATLALYDELALAPKPGLVSFVDSGSHDDMDARTFMRSLLALRGYFVQIAGLGWTHSRFEALEACGIEAEGRMLIATGGVNTHRGAIFMLGLLCAAAGAAVCSGVALTPANIRRALQANWGEALVARARRASALPGGIAAHRLGLRGASLEAALGFPTVFDVALPALTAGMQRGCTPRQARLDALFHVIVELDDSNLAHRGGLEALQYARRVARRFLDAGGITTADGPAAAATVHRDFVARRLSPGGAADTLAAACLISRVCGSPA